ncbi:hypothetical protein LOK49_LG04G01265 [Camellia lanceoleosa]|uniref:Uncharacterized protein n=1 Tax=Camellia lanceoleosa TaxID=1840588 RepID=A0ACC0I026_9ERIC|nr:hypothetical protein LOK49_LG04G01265 [Camellia lanceoleosa]
MWDLINSLLLSTKVCNTSSIIDTVVNSFFSSGGLLLNKARDWLFHDRSSNGQDLWDRANELYKEGRVSKFVHRKLIPSVVLDQVQLCIHIGVMYTEYDPELRPTMGRVYSMLSKNHSSSSTLVEEPMRDGSSSASASSTARNSDYLMARQFPFFGPATYVPPVHAMWAEMDRFLEVDGINPCSVVLREPNKHLSYTGYRDKVTPPEVIIICSNDDKDDDKLDGYLDDSSTSINIFGSDASGGDDGTSGVSIPLPFGMVASAA